MMLIEMAMKFVVKALVKNVSLNPAVQYLYLSLGRNVDFFNSVPTR